MRARDGEAEYRDLLIARESQISGWTEQPENRLMRKRLEALYADRLTLMVDLSAQDANLHTVFAGAIQDLARPWPASPPAVVLSEEHLESYHRNLLRLTYGSDYQGNAGAIAQSALLGAYGKPSLPARASTPGSLPTSNIKARVSRGRSRTAASWPQETVGSLSMSTSTTTCPHSLKRCAGRSMRGFRRIFVPVRSTLPWYGRQTGCCANHGNWRTG